MSLSLKEFLDETELMQEFEDTIWISVPKEVYLTALEENDIDQDVLGC